MDVATFELDTVPVTEADFLAFVEAVPEWRKDRAPTILAGDDYLAHWKGPLEPASEEARRRPVTRVSWFAARAYCDWQGARLPTTDDQGLDRQLFCAAGSLGATDRSDYAAFLRYAFRADLRGSDTGPLLGFRCARTA